MDINQRPEADFEELKLSLIHQKPVSNESRQISKQVIQFKSGTNHV